MNDTEPILIILIIGCYNAADCKAFLKEDRLSNNVCKAVSNKSASRIGYTFNCKTKIQWLGVRKGWLL